MQEWSSHIGHAQHGAGRLRQGSVHSHCNCAMGERPLDDIAELVVEGLPKHCAAGAPVGFVQRQGREAIAEELGLQRALASAKPSREAAQEQLKTGIFSVAEVCRHALPTPSSSRGRPRGWCSLAAGGYVCVS